VKWVDENGYGIHSDNAYQRKCRRRFIARSDRRMFGRSVEERGGSPSEEKGVGLVLPKDCSVRGRWLFGPLRLDPSRHAEDG
jgi:hypothetical protein